MPEGAALPRSGPARVRFKSRGRRWALSGLYTLEAFGGLRSSVGGRRRCLRPLKCRDKSRSPGGFYLTRSATGPHWEDSRGREKAGCNVPADGDHLGVPCVHGEAGGGAASGPSGLQQPGPAAATARSGLGKAEG